MRRAYTAIPYLLLTALIHPSLVDARLNDLAARKAALKCQKTLLSAATQFFNKELAALGKCSNKSVACVHEPDPKKRSRCLEALTRENPCNAALNKVLTPLRSEFGNAVAAACGGVLDPLDLTDAAGLGFGAIDAECSSIGSDASDADGIIECLGRVYRRSIERLFGIEAPRARELFQSTGINVTGLQDLPGYPGCQGCSVASADPELQETQRKDLRKCSNAIAGAGKSYASTAARVLSKCALALFQCDQNPQPLEGAKLVACLAKAETKCEQARKKAGATKDKASAKVKVACAPAAGAALAPEGGNLATLSCECKAVNVDTVSSIDEYLRCSELHHECRVAQLIKFAAPRLDELLAQTKLTPTLEAILCAVPADAPSVATSAALSGGCTSKLCRFLRAIRARFRSASFPFGVLTKSATLKPRPLTARELARLTLPRAPAAAAITSVVGDSSYAPGRSGEIVVGYAPAATATGVRAAPPALLIGVQRLDGSLVANEVFEVELETAVNQTELTVAYSEDVRGETGCSFRLVFGIDGGEDGLTPFEVDASACRINGSGDKFSSTEPGEDCDDNNLLDGDGCDSNCTITRCGNGIVTAGEVCDDGNLDDTDNCPSDCGVLGTPSGTPTPTPTATPTPLPRFVDNGNGTVTDNQTGLQWEKKTGAIAFPGRDCATTACPDPHDVNNRYTWCLDANVDFVCDNGSGPADGLLFQQFLAALNTEPCFAGHCDWRVPTVNREGDPAELETIFDSSAPGCGAGTPCVAQIFGPTLPNASYWSATTSAEAPPQAWRVNFTDGAMGFSGKHNLFLVRAVRTGP